MFLLSGAKVGEGAEMSKVQVLAASTCTYPK